MQSVLTMPTPKELDRPHQPLNDAQRTEIARIERAAHPSLLSRADRCLDAGMDPDMWPEAAWELVHELREALRNR